MLRAIAIGVLSAAAAAAQGPVLMTTEQALELAFPGCDVERSMRPLAPAERERATELASRDVDRAIVYPYVARKDGKVVGTAYFDAHRVRTKRETLMVVVDPQGRIGRVEVLAFAEPPDYLARPEFYAQFGGQELDEDLNAKRDIDAVSGATLTVRAAIDCARRVLATHRVLEDADAAAERERRRREEAERRAREAAARRTDRPTSRPTSRASEAPTSRPTQPSP